VTDDLPCFSTRATKAHSIGNRIQAAFKDLQKVLASHTLLALSIRKSFAELALKYAVDATNLLLFAELLAVTRQALSGFLSMLTRRVGTTFNGTLVGKALFGLQKKLLAFTATLTALRI
jgi:hypothetical protein